MPLGASRKAFLVSAISPMICGPVTKVESQGCRALEYILGLPLDTSRQNTLLHTLARAPVSANGVGDANVRSR